METMTQPKLTGYRQLTEKEGALINEAKALANSVGELILRLRTERTSDEVNNNYADSRWLDIAKADLQKGFMSLVRSIAKPESF